MRRQRRRWRKITVLLGVPIAGMLLGQRALAQEGPMVVGRREKRDTLKLENVRAALELIYRHESESVEMRNGPSTEYKEDHFEELFRLWATGYIVHPNLVELNLAGTFGLTQTFTDSNGSSDDGTGTAYEWDVSALILRKEAAPITLYSRRTRQTIDREFGPSLENTITQTGGVIDWRNKTVPTRIEIYRSDQEQKSLSGAEDFTLGQNTLNWHSEWQPSSSQRLTWDYTYNGVDQTDAAGEAGNVVIGGRDGSFDTHDATLGHTVDFGDKGQHNLTSSLTYFNQSGELSLERLRWSELLRLKHTDHFETRYLYTFDQQSTSQEPFGASEQTQHRAEAGFTHRLYKSLTTTGNLGFQSLEGDSTSSTEVYGNLDFEYRKQVPYGRFTGLLGFGFSEQDNEARSFQVVTASKSFPDALGDRSIVLIGQGIDARSIIIRDPSGLLLQPGFDYDVDSSVPGQVKITRLFGGRIDPGETVLFSYALEPQAANTTSTNSFRLGGRYDIEQGPLKGLSLFTRYTQQDQSISSDVPSQFIPNSFTDITYGAEYRIGAFTFGAEGQMHDSEIAPFDATRYYARWAQDLSLETTLALNAAYTSINYTEQDNTIDILTLSGQVQHRFGQNFYGYATVLWRDENDDLRGKVQGLEEQLELRWGRRQTHVYARVRNVNLDSDDQDNSFQMIEIGIRRDF